MLDGRMSVVALGVCGGDGAGGSESGSSINELAFGFSGRELDSCFTATGSSSSASVSSRTLSNGALPELARSAASFQSMPSDRLSSCSAKAESASLLSSFSQRSFSCALDFSHNATISCVSTSMNSLSCGVIVLRKGSWSSSPAEGRVGAFAINLRMNAFAASSLTSFRHSGSSP